ncbi:MAG: hypothetical protein Q4E72_06840 [bacterium]|nr:hypothetical protein [bacterium]
MKRLLCCLLALCLLAMASARAEDGDDPALEDLRQWLLGEYDAWIEIPYSSDNKCYLLPRESEKFGIITIQLNLFTNLQIAIVTCNNLVTYAPENALEVSRICNRLNQRWKCLCFINDTSSHTVSIGTKAPYLRAEDVSEVVSNLTAPIWDAIDDMQAQFGHLDCTGLFAKSGWRE